MPFVEDRPIGPREPYRTPVEVEPEGSLLGAAGREENPMFALYEILNRPAFPAQEGFDLSAARARRKREFDLMPHRFAGVESDAEFDFVADRIAKGIEDRERIAQGGLLGMVLAMTAGLLSPTVLIPVVGAAGSGARVASLVAGAIGGAAVDETLLRFAQPLRTGTDTALSLAGTTVLSSILGGAGMYISRAQLNRAAQALVKNPDEGAQLMTREEAEAWVRGTGTLSAKRAGGPSDFAPIPNLTAAGRTLAMGAPPLRPQLRAQDNPYGLVSQATVAQNISLAGIRAVGRKVMGQPLRDAVAEGGTIEHLARVKQDRFFIAVTDIVQSEFGNYLRKAGEGRVERFIRTHTPVGQVIPAKRGMMTWDEWNAAVYDAMNLGDVHPEPTVQVAAKRLREVATPVIEELQRLGIYKDMLTTEDLKGSLSYIMRIYDHKALMQRGHIFARKFAEYHNARLNEKFRAELEKRRLQIEKLDMEAALLKVDENKIEPLKAAIKAKLEKRGAGPVAQALEEVAERQREARKLIKEANEAKKTLNSPIFKTLAGSSAVTGQRRAAREQLQALVDSKLSAAAQLKAQAKAILEANPQIAILRRENATLRRALSLLNKSLFKLLNDQAKAVDEADRLYHATADFLVRFSDRLQRMKTKLDGMTDEAFDAQLQKLTDEWEKLDALMEKGERAADRLLDKFPELAEAPDELTRRVQRFREAIFAGLPMERGPKGELMLRIVPDFEGGAGYKDATAWAEIMRTQALERLDDFLARPEPWREVRTDVSAQKRALLLKIEQEIKKLKAQYPEGERPAQLLDDLERKRNAVVAQPNIRVELVKNPKGWLDADTPITPAMRRSAKAFRDEIAALKWTEPGVLAAAEARLDRLWVTQTRRAARAAAKLDAIRKAKAFDREAARVAMDEMIEDFVYDAQWRANKRMMREAKLRERAAKIGLEDIPNIDKRLDEIPAEKERLIDDLVAKYRAMGAEDIDVEAGKIDMTARLEEDAMGFITDLMSDNVRSGAMVIAEKRGPELARMMDLPYEDFKEFFIRDANRAWKAFARTVLPDIELAKRFGDASLSRFFDRKTEDGRVVRGVFGQELDHLVKMIGEDKDRAGNPLKGKLTEKEKERLVERVMSEYNRNNADLAKMIARVKNTDGMPKNPMAIGYRIARGVMNLNVVTLLGNAALASASDVARPIMKYGLLNTQREGWSALINDFKSLAQIAAEAGRGSEGTLSSRTMAWMDIVETNQQYTRLEQFIEAMATTFGKLSLVDYWTNLGQLITAGVANARFMHALERVMGNAGPLEMEDALRVLSDAGFSAPLAQGMWEALRQSGFKRLKSGTLDADLTFAAPDVRDAYAAYIAREIDDTIVRPGQERFGWMSDNIVARMVMQFRSFGVAMNTKGIVAGLQQRDLAVLNGVMGMLAMGAVSYYMWALQHGFESKQYKEMMNAGLDKWADEAIYRSGVLASLEELRALLSDFDMTYGLVNFSESGAERLRGRDFRETLLGVTMSQAMQLQTFLGGLDEPTQSTLHAARKLVPYQNLFYLRWLFTQIEESAGLPERRQ